MIERNIANEEKLEAIDAEIQEQVEKIYAEADASPFPDVSRGLRQHLQRYDAGEGTLMADTLEMTYREALQKSMIEEMDKNADVFLMGEDIGRYEGTFKVTKGLFPKYGHRRVIDTPDHRSRLRRHRHRRRHGRP